MKIKFALASLAAASALGLASGAFGANPSLQTEQMNVGATGLNLARPADVAKLYRRITFAARQVCGPRNITGFYYTWPGYQSCVLSAVQQGVAGFNNAALTAYFKAQNSPSIRVALE